MPFFYAQVVVNECVVAGWFWMHWRKSFAGSVLDHSIGKISCFSAFWHG
jgi:hypothetical protein